MLATFGLDDGQTSGLGNAAGAAAEVVVLFCICTLSRPLDAIHSGNINTFGVCLSLLIKWMVNCEPNENICCRPVLVRSWTMSPVRRKAA